MPAIEFNMKFFDTFIDIQYRMKVLNLFPEEFKKGYILYRQGILTFTYNHVVYRIPYNSIYYIEKEPLIKRCIIYTTNGKFFISRSINWLENVLEYGFIRTHQSCIVNIDNIKNIDFVSNVITFKNGMSTNLLANKKKKEVKSRVAVNE